MIKLVNKKGDIFNILFLLIILLIAAIVGLLMLTLSSKVLTFYEDTGLLNNTAIGQQAVDKLQLYGPTYTDYMIFFLFIGSTVGICISAIRTNFTPTIMFLFILMMFFDIFVAAGIVNIYQGFAQMPTLADIANQLTLTNFIFSRYTPLIVAILCALLMLLMWGKTSSDIVS